MSKKKVLGVFGNVAFYGQERANLQVFELLKNSGYDVLLAVNDLGFKWHLQDEVEARDLPYKKMRFSWDLRKTLKFKSIKAYFINIPKSNRQLSQLIKDYQPDYIHVCNDTHVMTLLPVLLRTKIKLIYRLGDKPSGHLSKFHRFLWKHYIIPRVDAFVCISKFVAAEVIKLGCPEEKITIIYNFPPKRLAEHSEEKLPERDESVVTFTFIGQLSKDKGIHLLVEAFIEYVMVYPNCRLLIAGSLKHNPDFTKQLIHQVENSGFQHKVLFLEQVKDIAALFAITDVNVIPSVYEEPLSNVIVEAKVHEKASIVFASGGLPELVSHKIDGYIISNKTVSSLVEAMTYYYEHQELIEHHGQEALKSMERLEISYPNFLEKWSQVYE
ncbi:glycosyltransferase family 4 protein [Psychroserpens sp. Hel_I_66]|uniref:glycosyltransferase family 4 protein n=1 Tax=Psychroserpens sp. Hel_I_66 TaxID=1250004 RepID=UPI0006461C1E|nr:glycosyltransferase family 4 protein [Psychroserpens sp. Hel_I_66]